MDKPKKERKPIVAGGYVGFRLQRDNVHIAQELNRSDNANDLINKILREYFSGGESQSVTAAPAAFDVKAISDKLLRQLEPVLRALVSQIMAEELQGSVSSRGVIAVEQPKAIIREADEELKPSASPVEPVDPRSTVQEQGHNRGTQPSSAAEAGEPKVILGATLRSEPHSAAPIREEAAAAEARDRETAKGSNEEESEEVDISDFESMLNF